MSCRCGRALVLAGGLLALGCASQGDEPTSGPAHEEAAPARASPTLPADPQAPAGEPEAPTVGPGPSGGQGAGVATATTGEWTVGIVAAERPGAGVAVLEEVRTARHDGFDRVVFTLSPAVPGHHVEYVDRPVRHCGSGDPVPLPGDGWLEVRLEPSAAHTEAGEATVGREVPVELENVRRLVLTCDFEAVVTWVLAVGSPNAYRVLVLDDPPRLVVDVRH